ncbi:MAG: hypothetical protein UY81_C0041G0004 [Candidatus Giovannonibacteria bacterium GW2011_GWA2_53_7]|uniref:DUF916 domain-containing protein n=1 Tax=Candidatus Giovannonibacteria bacterium GW2011_GWA2_53_7 TaxID=1618650 RepID=A0A0G1XW62_9BACT|nr:MAG: hypothetical protein UY81_C0041G0004 [Candidatus Giovannonibacteria bacterium GW2011_GWA2_53_7]
MVFCRSATSRCLDLFYLCNYWYPWRPNTEATAINNLMKQVFSFVCSLAFIGAFLGGVGTTAFAQESVGIKIQPTLIEEKVEPGMTKDYALKVENVSKVPLALFTTVRDIIGVGPDGRPIYAEDDQEDTYRVSSWVTFREKRVDLAPGESKTVPFTVLVPKDVSPGGHFGSVSLTEQPSGDLPAGTSIGFEVGAILSLQVTGDVVEDTRFRSFFSAKTVYGTPDVAFTVRLENLGNVVSRPVGLIDITNMWGRKVTSIPVNDTVAGIFPKSARQFDVKWKPDTLEFGRYEAAAAISVSGQKGKQTITSMTQFWILPTNILYPAVGGLLAFILMVYVFLRLYVRRKLRALSGARSGLRGKSGMSPLAAIVIALLIAVIIGFVVLFIFFG